MSEKAAAPANTPAKDTRHAFNEWMEELGAAIRTYSDARSEYERAMGKSQEYRKDGAKWKETMDRRLQAVVELLRQRCGNELVKGLAALGGELLDEEWREGEGDDWDLDDRVALSEDPPGGIDLSQRFDEDAQDEG